MGFEEGKIGRSDSIKWTKSALASYARNLFGDENIKSAAGLTDEQKTFLTEDLEERVIQIEAETGGE